MKHGRPTKHTQVNIQKKLRKYFEGGVTAALAAQKTNVNIKTVYRYFDGWSEEIAKCDTLDFIQRQKLERQRAIISYDKQILETIQTLDELKSQIKKCKEEQKQVPTFLFSHKLELQKFIVSTLDKKGVISAQVPLDEKIKQKISELIQDAKSKQNN